MELVKFDGIELAVDRFGACQDEVVLLIAGGGQSMDWWTPDFCRTLSGHGFQVIRYDHRDTGRSTASSPGHPRYTGEDLVTDPLRILDQLGIACAHLIGLSMGGGIAQVIAVRFPERVRTLTLMESSPAGGDPGHLPPPTAEVQSTFAADPPNIDWCDRAAVVDHRVNVERSYAGTSGFDVRRTREIAATEVDRTTDMESSMTNHFLVASGPDVDPAAIAAPTLVIHSTADPLFPAAHGRALAEMIPHCDILMLEGTGHEAPPPSQWSTVIPRLLTHLRQPTGPVGSVGDVPSSDSSWLDDIHRGYDIDAESYAREVEGLLEGSPHLRASLRVFAELIGEDTGERVADVGCGTGYVTGYLNDLGVNAFGIDISPEMLKIARHDHPSCHFEIGTMTQLSAEDAQLAGIVAFWSIVHVPDSAMPDVMTEFRRVLRSGGLLLVGFHVGDGAEHTSRGYSGRAVSFDSFLRHPNTVGQWMRDAGFTVISELALRPADPSPGALLLARADSQPSAACAGPASSPENVHE
ncbi:Pimeloyl-ACP methyl ester carboxylesterase [Brevibacterium siliguriense]|uniref:Pimeloyl-ACP methyl ester carboxylesterase n=1 Tax=Brevibacterium siliguriense TaxID=1136497 RepID=A0A1H1W5L8_9MICO|nr:alpha/beta fold hydrolase [Brevibacterium siliguriense]SDS92608.1 Pimeloyl-ACP methyl ester carboxylesterase [Brevibacterium siliguriense]